MFQVISGDVSPSAWVNIDERSKGLFFPVMQSQLAII